MILYITECSDLYYIIHIEDALLKLAKKKAPGVDHSYPVHLHAANNFAKHLLLMFNDCI